LPTDAKKSIRLILAFFIHANQNIAAFSLGLDQDILRHETRCAVELGVDAYEEQAECGRTEIRKTSCQLWPGAETAKISSDSRTKPGGLFLSRSAQSWPGCGAGSSAEGADREASALDLDDAAISTLVEFFQILGEWDREG
jgi:hypothetical protein